MTVRFIDHFFHPGPTPFVYPGDRRSNPISMFTMSLIKTIELAGWEVPNIDVEFRDYCRGSIRRRELSRISGTLGPGRKFKFSFSQDIGLSSAYIPKHHLEVFSDHSGPLYDRYVGTDWERDEEKFMAGSCTVNARLHGGPRIATRYKYGTSDAMLHPAGDFREYQPEGDEPREIPLKEVAHQINKFIVDVIRYAGSFPSVPGWDDVTEEGDANLRRLAHIEPIPAPEGFLPLFFMTDNMVAFRLDRGHNPELFADCDPVLPEEDYALYSGKRLCNLGVGNSKDDPFPEIAYHGFVYAFDRLDGNAGCVFPPSRAYFPVVLELKYLNDVYVIDAAEWTRVRQEMSDEVIKPAGLDGFTDEQVDQHWAAVARTLVPIVEYKGNYAEPVYLIGRQLGFDEARLLYGKMALFANGTIAELSITDAQYGRLVIWSRPFRPGLKMAAMDQIGQYRDLAGTHKMPQETLQK